MFKAFSKLIIIYSMKYYHQHYRQENRKATIICTITITSITVKVPYPISILRASQIIDLLLAYHLCNVGSQTRFQINRFYFLCFINCFYKNHSFPPQLLFSGCSYMKLHTIRLDTRVVCFLFSLNLFCSFPSYALVIIKQQSCYSSCSQKKYLNISTQKNPQKNTHSPKKTTNKPHNQTTRLLLPTVHQFMKY